MAAKPTAVPLWAYGMTASITVPMGAKMALGWLVAEKPPAQYFNWQWNLVGQWCDYVNDLANHDLQWLIVQHFNFGAVFAQATINGSGVVSTGNGTGYGLSATGGANGGGVRAQARGITTAGVEALGDLSGGVGGPGLLALAGTGAAGGVLTGNGAGAGAVVTGGATGIGLIAQGGTGAAGGVLTGNGAGAGAVVTGGATGIGLIAQGGTGAAGGVLTGNGVGAGAVAIAGTGSPALSAQGNATNAASASPKPCVDTVDGAARHGFGVDHLGLPVGRISYIRENWLFEANFTGAPTGQLIPNSTYWYSDVAAAMIGSVIVGNASGSADAIGSFGSLRDLALIYNGDAAQYNILYSSQLFGTRPDATISIVYEIGVVETVVGNEYRTGIMEIVAPLVGVLANHNPASSSNRLLVGYQNGINGNKWFIEWVRNGIADAVVDTGISIASPITVRFELIGANFGGPITRLYVNGQRLINKAAYLGNVSPAPLGLVGAIIGKVMTGSSTLRVSGIDIEGARTSGSHTL